MIDPLGKLVTELKNDAGVAALVGDRVRGGEPRRKSVKTDGTVVDEGDVRGPGHYVKFIVLTRLGYSRAKGKVPIQEVRVGYRCYAETPELATTVTMAMSQAIHNVGPRIGGGTLILRSYDDEGGGAGRDPNTDQPYEDGVIQAFAATEAVA